MQKLLETIKIVDGIPQHLSYHQNRLDYSCERLGYTSNYQLSDLLNPPKSGIFRCRAVYDDVAIEIEYIPYQPNIMRSLKAVSDDTIDYALKYANRNDLNALYKLRGSCDDVAIIKNGYLTDTTIANIALYNGQEWCTPRQPLLYGTTRQRLLDNNVIIEKNILAESIPEYEKCAIFNAMMGFVELENGIIF